AAAFKTGTGLFLFYNNTISIRNDSNYHKVNNRRITENNAWLDASGYIITANHEKVSAVIDPATLNVVCTDSSCFSKYVSDYSFSAEWGATSQQVLLRKNRE